MAISVFVTIQLKQQLSEFACIGMLTLFTVVLPFGAYSADPSAPNHLTVKGQVKLSSGAETSPEGLDVILLKFVLSPEGEVTPAGPQGRVKTNSGGEFEFLKVKQDLRAGYQLGTRWKVNYTVQKYFS